MRLLHIADVHLGHPFPWLGQRLGRERRAELGATLRHVTDVARANQVDALCIAGDLFERENALPAIGEFLRTTFAELADIPVLISPGNRDFLSPGCLYDQVAWPANVHIFRTGPPSAIAINDGTVWGSAFDRPERRSSPLAGFVCPSDGLHVGLFHADVIDEVADAVDALLAPDAIVTSGLRFALLGHAHATRIDEQRRFAYPGSLEPLSPDDEGPRNALLLDLSHDDLHIQQIPVAQRQVVADEIDVSALSTLAELRQVLLERRSQWEHREVKLRVVGVLQGELEDVDAVRSSLQDLDVNPAIVARPRETLAGLARQNTTLGAFVRDVRSRVDAADGDAARQYWSDVLRVGVAAFREREVPIA